LESPGAAKAQGAPQKGAAETEAAWQQGLGVIAGLTARFAQAEVQSGYRLDGLIDFLLEKKGVSGGRKKRLPEADQQQ
jgi:hypothetical protein